MKNNRGGYHLTPAPPVPDGVRYLGLPQPVTLPGWLFCCFKFDGPFLITCNNNGISQRIIICNNSSALLASYYLERHYFTGTEPPRHTHHCSLQRAGLLLPTDFSFNMPAWFVVAGCDSSLFYSYVALLKMCCCCWRLPSLLYLIWTVDFSSSNIMIRRLLLCGPCFVVVVLPARTYYNNHLVNPYTTFLLIWKQWQLFHPSGRLHLWCLSSFIPCAARSTSFGDYLRCTPTTFFWYRRYLSAATQPQPFLWA